MSEQREVIVNCDNCYPDGVPSFVTFVECEEIPGIFRGEFEQAAEQGWEERDYGHICPMCVQDEKELEDSGEIIRGPAVAELLLGEDEEDV